jgi:Holliday junction resolvase RusA-like endonuclease
MNAQLELTPTPYADHVVTTSAGPRYRITVYGSPAPQGSKKFVGTFTGRDGRTHANMVESSKKLRPWRNDVKDAAMLVRNGRAPLDGPLIVRMVFTVPKPASAPKTRRIYPCRMPDLSKLARSTEDALTDAAIWADDARVIEYQRLAKVYPNEDAEALEAPGVQIMIFQVGAT